MQLIYNLLGLPEDQAKFLISESLSILIGILFRKYCEPCPGNVVKRHLVSVLFGLLLGFFCFGLDLFHMIFVAYSSYLLLIYSPRAYSHLVIFAFDMAYLSSIHLYYQIYYYGQKSFDITSPLMVLIQKLTYLAFAFYDGSRSDDSKLTSFQREHLLTEVPTFLEFSSYSFNFQGIIVGPSCMFKDYIEFITGENVLKHTRSKDKTKVNYEAINIDRVIMAKAVKVLALIFIFLNVTVKFPLRYNIDPDMLSRPLWQRIIYFYISGNAGRMYFYIAWTLTDVVYNASGFGFNGYDEKSGEPKWDLINNINIWQLEKSTSMKGITDNWNIQTSKWLRAVAYERLPRGKTLGVFVLSAFWHGFYPGYYITFVQCAGLVYVGRLARRNIRPYFLNNRALFAFYDVLSWLCNHFSIYYVTAPFVFLDVSTSAFFFSSWYWCVHIGMIGLALLFSFKRPPPKSIK